MSNEEETTRTFDMSRLAEEVGLASWTRHGPGQYEKAIDLITKGSEGADIVQIFGSMPTDLAMIIAIRLYMIVPRLEWIPFNGQRNVIFSSESEKNVSTRTSEDPVPEI